MIANHNYKYRHIGGFTLIELIVSLVIFAFISLASFSALQILIRTKTQLDQRQEFYSTLQRAMIVIEDDMLHLINRPIINGDAKQEGSYVVYDAKVDSTFFRFTRYGVPQVGLRGETGLQRVVYRLEDKKLERGVYSVLDRTTRSEPIYSVILDNVDDVFIEQKAMLSNTSIDPNAPNGWSNTWSAVGVMPGLIRITLRLSNVGDIVMLFPGPQG